MLPYQSDSLARPPPRAALTTYVTVTSIVSQQRLLPPETLRPFQAEESGTKHVSWRICLAPNKKKKKPNFMQTSANGGLRAFGAIAVHEAHSKSAGEAGGPTTGGGGTQSGRSGPWPDHSSKDLFHHSCGRYPQNRNMTPIPRCRQK